MRIREVIFFTFNLLGKIVLKFNYSYRYVWPIPPFSSTCTCICAMKKKNISTIEQYVIDKVKEKRMKMKLSQADIAHKLELSEGFIGNIESPNYRAKYNIKHLNELAKIFNCSPRDFIPKLPLK